MVAQVAVSATHPVAQVALVPGIALRVRARSGQAGSPATPSEWVAEVALVVVPPQMRAHTHTETFREVRHKCHLCHPDTGEVLA